jgi:alkylation response protein AidB-like acyl-CoA dehydrogenase
VAPAGGFVTSVITAKAYDAFGSEKQENAAVVGAVEGRIPAIAMSEPDAGSDVAALRCRAERSADGCWVFTDEQLPADAVVGMVDNAWPQLMTGLNAERLFLAADMLGSTRRIFDTVEYVCGREQFGRPVGAFQALRHRLTGLATELRRTQLLVHDTAALCDSEPGKLLPREASMTKLEATGVAEHAAPEGMQMMGGYGTPRSTTGKAPAHPGDLDRLRRHERDSARHHRQDVRVLHSAHFLSSALPVLTPR